MRISPNDQFCHNWSFPSAHLSCSLSVTPPRFTSSPISIFSALKTIAVSVAETRDKVANVWITDVGIFDWTKRRNNGEPVILVTPGTLARCQTVSILPLRLRLGWLCRISRYRLRVTLSGTICLRRHGRSQRFEWTQQSGLRSTCRQRKKRQEKSNLNAETLYILQLDSHWQPCYLCVHGIVNVK